MILNELDTLLTFWLMTLTNLLGWNRVANKILRPAILRFFGFSFGPKCCLFPGMRIFSRRDRIRVGKHVFINQNCFFDAAAPITIGDYCQIGFYVCLITSSHELISRPNQLRRPTAAPITIEDGVWIGANVTVLPGIRIGQGAIIAAGAMVTRDVPPYKIVAGIPARVIGDVPVDEANQTD